MASDERFGGKPLPWKPCRKGSGSGILVVDDAGPGLPDRSDRWCPGQTSCGIWRRQAGISKAGGGTRRRSGVDEDLWSCLPYLHFKMT